MERDNWVLGVKIEVWRGKVGECGKRQWRRRGYSLETMTEWISLPFLLQQELMIEKLSHTLAPAAEQPTHKAASPELPVSRTVRC